MTQRTASMDLAGVIAPVTSSAIGSPWSLQGDALVLQLPPEAITTLLLNTYSQAFNILEIFTALSGKETETQRQCKP